MTIAEQEQAGKRRFGRIPADYLIIIILVFTATGSFGLGYLMGREEGRGGESDKLWIEDLSHQAKVLPAAAGAAASVAALAPAAAPTTASSPVETSATVGKYVASKNGTKYYLPTCGTAKRIKEENKVWFETKEQAQAAGFGPAANCPGL